MCYLPGLSYECATAPSARHFFAGAVAPADCGTIAQPGGEEAVAKIDPGYGPLMGI